MRPPDLHTEAGWFGYFTRAEADGALPNGTRVAKAVHAPGDAHAEGALATVIGSVRVAGVLGYFVEWDDTPRVACGVVETRIRKAGAS